VTKSWLNWKRLWFKTGFNIPSTIIFIISPHSWKDYDPWATTILIISAIVLLKSAWNKKLHTFTSHFAIQYFLKSKPITYSINLRNVIVTNLSSWWIWRIKSTVILLLKRHPLLPEPFWRVTVRQKINWHWQQHKKYYTSLIQNS